MELLNVSINFICFLRLSVSLWDSDAGQLYWCHISWMNHNLLLRVLVIQRVSLRYSLDRTQMKYILVARLVKLLLWVIRWHSAAGWICVKCSVKVWSKKCRCILQYLRYTSACIIICSVFCGRWWKGVLTGDLFVCLWHYISAVAPSNSVTGWLTTDLLGIHDFQRGNSLLSGLRS